MTGSCHAGLGSSPKLSSSGFATSMTNLIVQNLQLHIKNFLLSKGSVLVLCSKFNVQIRVVVMLVTNANTKGFGLTSLSGVRSGFLPPQLKTKHSFSVFKL